MTGFIAFAAVTMVTAVSAAAPPKAVVAAAPAAPAAAESPAIVAAKSNRVRVKTPPTPKSTKIDWYADALASVRATGQHGRVMVEGIIGVDGAYTDVRVRTSSRGAALDALALKVAAALRFVPAKDATAKPIAIWALYPFEFDVLEANVAKVATYRCDMAVRDWDWWRAAWPDLATQRYPNYDFFTGFELLGRTPPDRMATFAARWGKAFEICRGAPTRLFEEVLRTAP